jgi:Tetratricopeptide repeat-like domain
MSGANNGSSGVACAALIPKARFRKYAKMAQPPSKPPAGNVVSKSPAQSSSAKSAASAPAIEDDGKDAIFREVDEELRREQMAKIWEQYGTYILGAAALIIVGVGGWKWLEARRLSQIEAASIRYDAASQLAVTGKADEAQAALAVMRHSPNCGSPRSPSTLAKPMKRLRPMRASPPTATATRSSLITPSCKLRR